MVGDSERLRIEQPPGERGSAWVIFEGLSEETLAALVPAETPKTEAGRPVLEFQRINTDTPSFLGKKGWQGAREGLPVEKLIVDSAAAAVRLQIGPQVVNQIECYKPIRVRLEPLGLSGECLWPDLEPYFRPWPPRRKSDDDDHDDDHHDKDDHDKDDRDKDDRDKDDHDKDDCDDDHHNDPKKRSFELTKPVVGIMLVVLCVGLAAGYVLKGVLVDRGFAGMNVLLPATDVADESPNGTPLRNLAEAEDRYNQAMLARQGRDPEEAEYWFRAASALGDVNAMNELGGMYFLGQGVRRDRDLGIEFWEVAGALGSSRALFNLGKIHEEGRGVEADPTRAVYYYERSAALGNIDARGEVERLTAGVTGNEDGE